MGSYSPDSSITGSAQTNLTSPTYTLVEDQVSAAPNSRQHVVTACGGTQTDVRASTANDPFTVQLRKFPYRALPPRNPTNGAYSSVPRNRVEWLFRKGMKVDSAGLIVPCEVRIVASTPAGAELNDPANIRALWSFVIGLMTEESSDIGDSMISGVW